MITSSTTLCRITALSSLGLYRIRRSCVRATHPRSPIDRKPYLVSAIGLEVVSVPLYGQPCVRQDFRKSGAEVAVGEKDNSQAARS